MASDRIYDYVVDSINNIISNGINYYENNNDFKHLKKLIDIYEYINKDSDKEKLIKYKIELLNNKGNDSLYFNNNVD